MKDFPNQQINKKPHPQKSSKPKTSHSFHLVDFLKKTYFSTVNVLTICLVSLSIWQFYKTANQEVLTVKVQGTENVQQEEILASIRNLTPNFWNTDVFFVENELIQNIWIDQVEAIKTFPNQLLIEIKERTPICYLRIDNEIFYLDEEFFLLPAQDKSLTESLPELEIPFQTRNISKEQIRFSSNQRQKVNELLALLSNEEMLPSQSIRKIVIESPYNIKLIARKKNWEILIGMQSFEAKLAKLKFVMAQLKRREQKIKSIDLRAPSRVVLQTT